MSMCLSPEELMNHLLLHCDVSKKIWQAVLSLFQCCGFFPRSIVEHFAQKSGIGTWEG